MPSTRELLGELESLRGRYAPIIARRKRELLQSLLHKSVCSAHLLKRLHAVACLARAFPDDPSVLAAAGDLLAAWAARVQDLTKSQRESLIDTGMAGTSISYEFSYHVACLLADRYPNAIDINWDEYEEPERLDELLCLLIGQAEEQTFEDGEITTRQWVKLAKGKQDVSDLVWLLHQTRRSRKHDASAESMYDNAEVPLVWRLGNTSGSTTKNAIDAGAIVYRFAMRKPPERPRVEIAKPLHGIQLLSEDRGKTMIRVAIDALAARYREVFSMTHANPTEVYLAPLGEGTHAAIMGVVPHHRLHLEGNYGYVLLANGRPVGYGGVSPLFLQGNTGINVFPEYRGSEGAFLFVQLLRAFHTLFGITRFVANPYQFGRGNSEAIKSGAFWFYYRLGFRPVDVDAAKLAQDEYRKILARRGYRSDRATLRRLAKSDFHLTLPKSRKDEFFKEQWLATCALGATAVVAAQPGIDRVAQRKRLTERVAESIGIANWASWSAAERRALERLSPTIALAGDLDRWTRSQERSLERLIRAKCASQERDYVRLLGKHKRFRESLAKFCRDHG